MFDVSSRMSYGRTVPVVVVGAPMVTLASVFGSVASAVKNTGVPAGRLNTTSDWSEPPARLTRCLASSTPPDLAASAMRPPKLVGPETVWITSTWPPGAIHGVGELGEVETV